MKKIEIDTFLKFQFVSNPSFSPDGKYIAFVVSNADRAENTYKANLYVYDMAEKKVRKMTSGGDAKSYVWTNDNTLLFPAARCSEVKKKQEAGEDKMSAIKDAALQRLRPILMTSASTVLGLIPLAFATGEGCNQRIAMGTAVVGGMVVSTLLTMYIVPAIYSYISTNRIKKLQE